MEVSEDWPWPFPHPWRQGRGAGLGGELTDSFSLQVYSRANEHEPCGWWLARVRMMKGDVSVAEAEGPWFSPLEEPLPEA